VSEANVQQPGQSVSRLESDIQTDDFEGILKDTGPDIQNQLVAVLEEIKQYMHQHHQ